MPAYAYTARTYGGKTLGGTRAAGSEDALALDLAGDGLFLLRARPVRGTPGRAPKLRRGDLEAFLVHLASYLEAGLPLATALQDCQGHGRTGMVTLAADMGARLAEGARLSDMCAAHPGIFQPAHVAMVRAGEASGRMDEALRGLIALLAWNEGLRRRLRALAAQPLIVLGTLGVVAAIVSVHSLPILTALLSDLGVPLPGVTRVFLGIGEAASRWGWLLPVLAAAGWAARTWALRIPALRLRWDGAKLALPGVGDLLARTALARTARVLAAQCGAGVPLVSALESCEGVPGNAKLARAVAAIRRDVEGGGRLSDSAAATGLFPPFVLRMMKAGESSGRLEEALQRAASRLDAEVEERVRVLFQIMDPCLKFILAGLLVFVASALLLPLYAMIGAING